VTAEEIMALIATPDESQFYRRFNFGPSFLALQDAIRQVVRERDEARVERDAALRELSRGLTSDQLDPSIV